jgi:hypothetical protein
MGKVHNSLDDLLKPNVSYLIEEQGKYYRDNLTYYNLPHSQEYGIEENLSHIGKLKHIFKITQSDEA